MGRGGGEDAAADGGTGDGGVSWGDRAAGKGTGRPGERRGASFQELQRACVDIWRGAERLESPERDGERQGER